MLLLTILLGVFSTQQPLLTDDEAIQYVEAHPEIIEFAASREEEPLTVTVDAWLTSQPANYSGILKRIRDRRRPPAEVENEKKKILGNINNRRIEKLDAKTDLQKAKAQKWAGLLWGGVGIAIAFVGFAFAIGYIINSFRGG